MQLRMLEAGLLTEHSRPQKSADAGDSDWSATVARAVRAEAVAPSSEQAAGPSAVANRKLSELLVAHMLREIMPAGGHEEGGLAFDTWRGMLADAIAQEVGPHIDVLSSVRLPHGER